MTTKDYELIARIVITAIMKKQIKKKEYENLIDDIIHRLSIDNSRFDVVRFYTHITTGIGE